MNESLTDSNVDIINQDQGTNYPYGITYQNLYDSRDSLGSQRGRFKEKNGVWFVWVLPNLKGEIDMKDTDPNTIIEVTEDEYLSIHLPTYDVENTEELT